MVTVQTIQPVGQHRLGPRSTSLLAGLEARQAYSSASSLVIRLVQVRWGKTRMSAVVRVPVLSLHSTVMEALVTMFIELDDGKIGTGKPYI